MRPILLPICLLLLIASAAPAAETVRVERREPAVARRTFDPKKPPAEMPKLSKSEAALCQADFGVSSEMSVRILKDEWIGGMARSTAQVEWVKVVTTLEITIWLPTNAWEALKAHEEAHRKLSEKFYEDSEAIARKLAGEYEKRTLVGTGPDFESARDDAINKAVRKLNGDYLAATQAPAARTNILFDEVTDHGRKKISAEEGMKRALERYRKEAEVVKGASDRP